MASKNARTSRALVPLRGGVCEGNRGARPGGCGEASVAPGGESFRRSCRFLEDEDGQRGGCIGVKVVVCCVVF